MKKYYSVDQYVMNKKNKNLSIGQVKILILEFGGVVPQGHGKDYYNYLKLIEKYKHKVQHPVDPIN